jgi:hypothetical protein
MSCANHHHASLWALLSVLPIQPLGAAMSPTLLIECMPDRAFIRMRLIWRHCAAASSCRCCHLLQLLQTHWEAGTGCYPVTRAVLHLTATLLSQHYVTGPMSSLVMFCTLRVLPALGWLPFSSDAERWELTSAALQVVRAALDAGAVAAAGGSAKLAGPPVGLKVTALAAACVHQLATSGEGKPWVALGCSKCLSLPSCARTCSGVWVAVHACGAHLACLYMLANHQCHHPMSNRQHAQWLPPCVNSLTTSLLLPSPPWPPSPPHPQAPPALQLHCH